MDYIAELKYPGTFISHHDKDWNFKIRNIINSIDSSFVDAVIAFTLYDQIEKFNPIISKTEFLNRQNQISEICDELEQLNPINNFDFQAKLFQREEARILFMRKEIRNGNLPYAYQKRLVFIYARSYLYSIDRIGKLLRVLKDEDEVSTDVSETYEKFTSAFPNLQGVRNSSAHIEDRVRNLARKKTVSPNNVIYLENLLNGNFSSTMEDGSMGEVEISFDKILITRDCIQTVIDSFKWDGSPKISPTF